MIAPAALEVGDIAPPFELKDGQGHTVRLEDFRGETVVVYLYPKDDTPGCTKEACAFRDERATFAKAGAVVLGVSADTEASHRKFSDKYGLTFPLLSDPDHAVCQAYGVYGKKSMYGRTYFGIVRTTFVIDPRGRIAAVFPRVKVDGHADEVLAAIRAAAPPAAR